MPSLLSRRKLNSVSKDSKHPIFKWFGRFFMSLGILMFISTVISVVAIFSLFGGAEKLKPLPNQFVLAYSFKGSMPEMTSNRSIIAQLMEQKTSLYDFMRALDKAKTDNRITAFVAKITDGDYSLTQIQTIRNAVIDFRSSGKKAYIYTDSFGGFSNGTGEYWLASAFDEIWVQPIGTVSINGMRIEQPYIKDALGIFGISMEMEQRKSYKTGPEMYLRNDMSVESRETLAAILHDVMGQISADVTKARNITADEFKRAIDMSPLTVNDADKLALIDRIGYLDEFEKHIGAGELPHFVGISRYASDVRESKSKTEKVAIISINGMILEGSAMSKINVGPMVFSMQRDIANASDIAMSIDNAADDKNIKVILLRINSPGGSPVASEIIRRAVVNAREKGKYIIASMGDVAASGGYWIAVNANQIIASKLTITGSIGVYGGKPNLSGLWDKIGVNWDVVEYGQNASMWTPIQGMNKTERARLNVMMDNIYDAFTSRVAAGRNMSVEGTEKVAQGRAWMGETAKDNGLVDLNGGFDFAIKRAASEAGGLDWQSMPMRVLPKHDDPFKEVMKLLNLPFGANIEIPTLSKSLIQALIPNAVVTMPEIKVEF